MWRLLNAGSALLDQAEMCIRLMSGSRKIVETRDALLEQLADFGSWEYNLATGATILSGRMLEMCEMNSGEGRSDTIPWKHLHAGDRERALTISKEAITACKPFEFVVRYRMTDGHSRLYFARGFPIADGGGKTERVLGVVRDITEIARSENERLNLVRALMRARDDERRRVSLDLHESAGQSLAALKMSLGLLRDALPKRNKGALALLRSSLELAEGAIREVRTISYLMHPPMLDEAGLHPALRWYARGFSERSGIQVRVDVAETIGRYPQEIEITIFRLVQEALTNVHRYSGSRTALICLARENHHIRAEIQDEGCGFQFSLGGPSGCSLPGVGIAGMRERVEQLKGTLEIESVPGHGTTIRAMLPLAPSESSLSGDGHEDLPDASPQCMERTVGRPNL